MKYNYDHFKIENFTDTEFVGPKAGEVAPEFTLQRLDGETVKFNDYRGKWVVMETGSLTCSMYVKNVKPVSSLVSKYPDVEFLVVYVREAHPGSRRGAHKNLEEKIRNARECQATYKEHRKILIDGIEGEWHQQFGGLPNMVYVFNPEGMVIYRCNWAYVDRIDKVLSERDKIHTDEKATVITTPLWVRIPVLLKGGWGAIWDSLRALPKMIRYNKQVQHQVSEHVGTEKN